MQPRSVPPTEGKVAGSVEGTALWTVVTLNGANKYSGAVEVRQASRVGTLFFDEGRIVHAETGATVGEAAFRQIMRWSDATYSLQPEAVANHVSVTKSLARLLVDLKGLWTEPEPAPERTPPSSPAPASPAARLEWLVATVERIGRIPGVLRAMLHGKDGPIGGLAARTPEDEEALALGRSGKGLGDALGLGRLVLGVGRGTERLVLLLPAREHQITILVRADEHVDAVQAKVRSLLNPQS